MQLPSGRTPPKRRSSLDGLRTIAIVAVFVYHCVEPVGGGFLGVDVFFVLSGFLMTGILYREITKTDKLAFGIFLVRRLRRLYPALLATVALATILAAFTDTDRSYTLAQAPFALLYLTDVTHVGAGLLDHTWSLSVEAQFYLVWPVVMLVLIRTRRIKLSLALLTAAAALLPFIAAARLSSHQLYYSPIGHVAALLVGGLVAVLPPLDGRTARLVAPIAAVILLLVLAEPIALIGNSARQIVSVLVAAGLTGFLIWSLTSLADAGLVATVLSWRPLAYLGLRSYGFYLYHQPLLFAAEHVLPKPAAIPIAFLLTVALSILSWRFWRRSCITPDQQQRRQLLSEFPRPLRAASRVRLFQDAAATCVTDRFVRVATGDRYGGIRSSLRRAKFPSTRTKLDNRPRLVRRDRRMDGLLGARSLAVDDWGSAVHINAGDDG